MGCPIVVMWSYPLFLRCTASKMKMALYLHPYLITIWHSIRAAAPRRHESWRPPRGAANTCILRKWIESRTLARFLSMRRLLRAAQRSSKLSSLDEPISFDLLTYSQNFSFVLIATYLDIVVSNDALVKGFSLRFL